MGLDSFSVSSSLSSSRDVPEPSVHLGNDAGRFDRLGPVPCACATLSSDPCWKLEGAAALGGVRFCDPRRFLQNHVTPTLSGAQTPEIGRAQRAPSRDSLSLTLNTVSLFPTRSAR